MGIEQLFENNREWAASVEADEPGFFASLAGQQSPKFLWIGCSDSRVPANEIIGLRPGEVFVHRNVANLVLHTDFNCLSVVEFAVSALKVEHILVTGHYRCGGVKAALEEQKDLGLIDNWLHSVGLLAKRNRPFLDAAPNDEDRLDRLCELNVIDQVWSLCGTTTLRHAWARGQNLCVHGCIYGLRDGLLKDLGVTVCKTEEVETVCSGAINALKDRFQAKAT